MGMSHRVRGVLIAGLSIALPLALVACSGDDGASPDAAVCAPVDDGNECTADVCRDGDPVHDPVTPGTPCATGSCSAAGTCAPATCTDAFTNGDETDADCGGGTCPTCAAGDACDRGADCASGVCTGMICQPVRCGDGVMQAGEMCDDGNDTNGDGCDDGAGDACRATGCGNGVVTAPEVCDDGNAANADGCDNNCTPSGCGNGVRAGAEACDDGNAASNDGCSLTCAREPGYTCTDVVPNVCTTTCGDGVRAGAEGCDDAPPAENGDGCSINCTVETGYTCSMATPNVCTSMCGDGVVASNEGCDDAPPAENGDGCSMACTVEPGFACAGSPSMCVRRCGNGTVDAGEQCDDANQVAGDGCSNACAFDLGCGAGEQQRVASATPALLIPDNDPVGVRSPVTVVGGGAVTRVVAYVGSITHSFDGDLDLALISPTGLTRELAIRRGAEGDNYRQTFFTDAAATTIAAGVAPFTGRFKPDQSLTATAGADFTGGNGAGTWNLRVFDAANQDEGTLDAWSLVMCVNPTAPFCGDGVRGGAEECDDGNAIDNDACSNLCRVTMGCGNGALDVGEQCDDDNLASGDGCSAACQVDITCPAGQTPVVLGHAGGLAIPDNDPAGVSAPVTVVTVGAVTRVTAVITGLTHTADGDLDITLLGPAGVRRELSTDNGGVGDNYAGTQLDDAGATAVTAAAAPFTGRFTPEQSLSTTAGVDFLRSRAAGVWSLRVVDDTATETGTLGRWTLAACVDPAATFCGDGVKNGNEECDDGNTVDADACSNLCQIATGCGNGVLDVGEQCDDDNLTAGDGCSPTCAPDIACGPGQQVVIVSHPASAAIPDDPAGLLSTVAVASPGLVRRAIAIVNVTHADDAQLDLFLESPRGVQHDLSSDQAGAGYRATIFSDSAATSIVAGVAPYTGAFQPEQQISTAAGFADQQAEGTWYLRVSDDTVGTAGTLDGWSLALCVDAAAGATRCGNGVVEVGETCDDGAVVAGDGCSPTCQLELGCAGGQTAVVVSAADLPKLVPDNLPAGASSVVNVAGAGTVAKAIVAIGTITHTFDGDLDLVLVSPTGTMIDLSSGNGSGGDDYVSTIFADGAATTITTAVPPMRGRFAPEAALAGVATPTAAGAWTLKVVDHANADTGVVVSWSLGLCVAP